MAAVELTLLTVEELVRRVEAAAALDEEDLHSLLASAQQDIEKRAGTLATVTERFDGGSTYLFLRRPTSVADIETVTETLYGTETVLATDDWELDASGSVLRRLDSGTNAASWWYPVVVEYTPLQDVDSRKRVQAELIQLELNYKPLLSGQQIGAWSEQYATNSAYNYQEERETILASLMPNTLGFA